MRAQLRNQVAALFLLAPAALTFTALPTAARAQAATPGVRGFTPAQLRTDRVPGEFRDRGREHARPAYDHVPIQILRPGNNARVDGSFARVRGRTVPFASIQVTVQAQPGQNGGSQRIWEQLVRADANGDFEFNFVAPSPAPGTRYDVSMVAHTPDATSESHLVLYQRG